MVTERAAVSKARPRAQARLAARTLPSRSTATACSIVDRIVTIIQIQRKRVRQGSATRSQEPSMPAPGRPGLLFGLGVIACEAANRSPQTRGESQTRARASVPLDCATSELRACPRACPQATPVSLSLSLGVAAVCLWKCTASDTGFLPRAYATPLRHHPRARASRLGL